MKNFQIIVGAGLAPALDYVHAHKERAIRESPLHSHISKKFTSKKHKKRREMSERMAVGYGLSVVGYELSAVAHVIGAVV